MKLDRATLKDLDAAILAAVAPTVHVPIYSSVHRQVYVKMSDRVRGGDIDDRIRVLLDQGTLIYQTGRLLLRLRPVRAEHGACRARTSEEQRGVHTAEGRRAGRV